MRDPLNPLQVIGLVIAAAAVALLVAAILHVIVQRLGRRSLLLANLSRKAHRPTQATLVLLAVAIVLRRAITDELWRDRILHVLVLGLIASVAWLVGAAALAVEDAAVSRFRTDVEDDLHARQVRTQAVVLRRLTVVAIAIVALGAMLLTFPVARTAGASLLASAGVAGIIGGLAAQSTLGNVIAGTQIAFSESIRLEDVVVVEQEWGRVEDITLTYVVVRLWDDRRMVFPTSYFTTTPFQNWTRSQSAILGTVELDVDWTVPVEEVRAELRRVLESTELWDSRVSVLQVTDAVGGFVRLRALVSAKDAPTSWDLRCLVRERLVGWLCEHAPGSLPRVRAELPGPDGRQLPRAVAPPRPAPADRARPDRAGPDRAGPDRGGADLAEVDPSDAEGADARVFGGSPEAEERGAALAGPDHDGD
jgi:small-conductance mechanosensitive channel